MVNHGSVVAIVPARGGSKSIPRKNLRPLGGAPLLSYSIAAGLSSTLVDRVIVSTDDDEMASIARAWGADVPFMRPPSLAQDATLDLPVFQHALEWLQTHEGGVPEIVVQLRPTSPLRPPGSVDRAIELLRRDPAADSVRTVARPSQNPYKMWRLQDDGAIGPLLEGAGPEPFNQPRQALPVTYWQTGHIDAIRSTTILQAHSMTGRRILPLIIDAAYSCDIDTELDLQRVEWTLAHSDWPIVRPRPRAALPTPLRLVVFDFDGVMTDNRVWVSESGSEWVACDRSDGLGVQVLKRLGVDACVLSTEENPVVGRRCAKLGLRVEQGLSDKAARLRQLLGDRGIDPLHVVYVGNDVNDLGCMRLVGCAVAVADAHPDVLREADLVLARTGGHGAVRELCDRIAAHVGGGVVDIPIATILLS
jgi:N-acylneuraminate cytidylyltransferase